MDSLLITVAIGNHTSIELEYDKQTKRIRARANTETIDAEYLMMVNVIVETMKAQAKGIPINRYFNPLRKSKIKFKEEEKENFKYYKMKWNKNGTLKMVGPTDKRFRHVNTAEEAILRKRIFTCDVEKIGEMPLRKPEKDKKENKEALIKEDNINEDD
jgi:hypothetical protein